MKYSEKWGDSIDAAVKLALADLGLTEEQVEITVLEEPSKGFFGLGSKLAKVRVEEKSKEPEKKVEKPAAPIKEAKKNEQVAVKEVKKEVKKAEIQLSERPKDLVPAQDHIAQSFLTDLVHEMGLKVDVKTFINDKMVYIEIDGPDSGTVIGKRGTTLDAIQYLTSLVVNKDDSGYTRVVINAEGYREKREKTLEKLANRLADKAVKTGKSVRLEPMNPYERKVIHTTLQARPEVRTRSEGEEPYRKVVIDLARK